jgi:hypothetical protein
MKKIVLFFLISFSFSTAVAQDYTAEELEMIQEIFGDEKREIIADNINFEGVNMDAFWKIYDDYEAQRKDIGTEKVKLLKQYTTKQGNMTPLQADEMLAEAANLRAAEDKLIMNATKRIRKMSNPFVAAQFYQIEHYISDGIRFTILNNIDFIQD